MGVTIRGARRGRGEEVRRGDERREEMRGEARPNDGGWSSRYEREELAQEGKASNEHGWLK